MTEEKGTHSSKKTNAGKNAPAKAKSTTEKKSETSKMSKTTVGAQNQTKKTSTTTKPLKVVSKESVGSTEVKKTSSEVTGKKQLNIKDKRTSMGSKETENPVVKIEKRNKSSKAKPKKIEKRKIIIWSGIATTCVLCLIIGLVFGLRNPSQNPDDFSFDHSSATQVTNGYETGFTRAMQTSEYLGEVKRIVKPVDGVRDCHEDYGVKEYPSWGKNLTGYTVEERDGIILESHSLTPYPTWKSLNIYDAIDSEGYLLRNGERVKYVKGAGNSSSGDDGDDNGVISGGLEEESGGSVEEGSANVNAQYKDEYRKLYKHSGSVNLYGGNVDDSEPRIIKRITALNHKHLESTQITGLYAPAGEVIKIELSKNDFIAAGGLRILIGQNYNLWQHVAMETSGTGIKGTGLNRMSDLLNIFEYKSNNQYVEINGDIVTLYVGSFLGGPIYFRPISNSIERSITVTISGGVKYQHFILGVTTPEEYELNRVSSAPYFDLEVYDEAVRFTTTKYTGSSGLMLKDYTYENCTDAAILWDKISQVSKRVQANGLSASSAPVYIIGDCYVAAGAAFANPGRNGIVCPPSWLAEALNYNTFVNNGCWGTMHEYNHCWQGYGLGSGGEVTNNATTLVAYSLYTRISSFRTIGGGVGGWNRFTDPGKALEELLRLGKDGSKRTDLSAYAALLHNIGQDMFITAAHGGREKGSTTYYNQLVNATHLDMTYYFTEVLNFGIGGEASGVGTITQEAVDVTKSKNYPVFVPVASTYQVGRSIIYDGEKRYITTAQPFSYGTGEFTMSFNKGNSTEFVIPEGFTVKVVEVTQPTNGKVERLADNKVKYIPGNSGLYSGEFKVKLKIIKDDGAFIVDDVELVINLKQGLNTNLQRTTYIYDEASAVPATNSVYNAETNTFDFGGYSSIETKKNVCTQETNTQIWAAGWNYDDDSYIKGSTNYRVMPINKTIQTIEGIMYFTNSGAYRFTLKGRGKATLYLSYDNGKTWEAEMSFDRTNTRSTAYVDSEYAEHEFSTEKNYVYFKVVLYVTKVDDFFGVGFSVKQEDGTFSTFTNVSNAFLNADIHKLIMEESTHKFETEYRYKKEYKYSYSKVDTISTTENSLISVSHDSWDENQKITNLFDEDENTKYHSKKNVAITADKPFELVVDLGAVYKVNTVTFNGYNNITANNGMVKTFELYGSLDGIVYFLLIEKTNNPGTAKAVIGFDEAEIKYYKLIVTDTYSGNHYFAMASIVFSYNISYLNGYHIAPNDESVTYTGKHWTSENVLCNFGRIFKGEKGDYVELKFTGTRFLYLAYQSNAYDTVDIYIDGKLVATDVSLSGETPQAMSEIYISDALEFKEHTIKIVGKEGKFNIDSFVYWKD